jgi:CheY-like chemotaxis protein
MGIRESYRPVECVRGDGSRAGKPEGPASFAEEPERLAQEVSASAKAAADVPAASSKADDADTGAADGREDPEDLINHALIYIVDDTTMIGDMLSAAFRIKNLENVKVFSDGDEVLAAMFDEDGQLREIPDAIVCDTDMDRIGGPELYARIKSVCDSVGTVFVAMSGDPDKRKKWGDIPFFKKPFRLFEILDFVTDSLKKRGVQLRN